MNKQLSNGSGLGLDSIGNLSSLLADSSQTAVKESGPLLLNLEKIVEDPNQPRSATNPGFSKESLNELAETVKLRGIKTPISVREIPDGDQFMINHGARRYRAARIAGLSTIPAFVDNDYNEADQVIENLQRNDLTPREIADYIGRELAKGRKKGEIAKDIGKSAAFIKQHATLLDLPEPIAILFNSERVRDVTLINDLVTLYKKYPSEVESWLSDSEEELSRGSFKLFREFLINKSNNKNTQQPSQGNNEDAEDTGNTSTGQGSEDAEDTGNTSTGQGREDTEDTGNIHPDPETSKFKKAIVQVRHDNRLARLILTKRPHGAGFAWLKYDDDGEEFETELNEVQLVAVIEG